MRSPKLHLEQLKLRIGGMVLELKAPVVLEAGCIYLLQGRSGAGKSSICRALLGLSFDGVLAEGKVSLQGADDERVPLLDENGFNQGVHPYTAFLPQSGRLGFIDELSPLANATLLSELSKEDARLEAEKLASKLRIWPLPSRLSHASGGEGMRISALRALLPRSKQVRRPALVVADEATTGLDYQASERLGDILRESASSGDAITLVVSHEPSVIVGEAGSLIKKVPSESVVLHQFRFGESGLVYGGEVAHFVRSAVDTGHRFGNALKKRIVNALTMLGDVALSPLACIYGLFRLKRRLLVPFLAEVLRTVFNPTTWLFVGAAAFMMALTMSVFVFQLFPRRDLIEPLLLEDILSGFGTVLCLMLMPLFAAIFAVAKNGAAQSARLSSSVRSGLLETLTLANIRLESYALAPAIIGQILSLALCTLFAIYIGLVASAAVFLGGGSALALDQAMAFIRMGMDRYPDWTTWVILKIVVSGAAGGAIAALFGLRPVASERDVAKAVHRTLLWSMIAVLCIQCAFIIAQFDKF